MNKMVVGVFGTELAAYEGLSALKDLHKDGDITLYATAVIAKDSGGAVTVNRAPTKGRSARGSDCSAEAPWACWAVPSGSP